MKRISIVAAVVAGIACGGGGGSANGGGAASGGGSATGGGSAGGGSATGGGSAGGGAASQPHLDPPDCGTPGDAGTSTDIFNDIVGVYGCSAGGCHGPGTGFQHYQMSDAPSMRTAWIDAGADERPGMNRVTPGNIDQSYVLYKLLNQQVAAGGSGDQMPQGGPYLSDGDVCKVVNWVKAGAP